MVTETSKGMNPAPPGGSKPTRLSSAEKARRRHHDNDAAGVSDGAAAAQRASAGMGTEDAEPAAWLFGDSLGEEHSG